MLTSEVSSFGTRGRNLTASALTLDERPFSKPDLRFGAAAERLNLPYCLVVVPVASSQRRLQSRQVASLSGELSMRRDTFRPHNV